MRRLWSVLICLLLLLSLLPVPSAEAASTIEQQIGLFIEQNKLSPENFSLSYYNATTGESCAYNPDAMIPAGSLWMLPLHMYFSEQESLGVYDPSFDRPADEFTIAGLTLKECRYESLLLGRENVALAMRDYLGGHESYKLLVNEAFGHLPEKTLNRDYLGGNCFNVTFWMNCFRELTEHPMTYDDLNRNYTILQTADALAGYGRGFTIYQLRGEEDGWITAMAKVWGSEAYSLVCSIRADVDGDRLLGELNRLVCDFVEEQADLSQRITIATTEMRDLSVATDNHNQAGEMLRWIGIAIGGALGVAALIALPVWIIRRRKDDVYYD